MILIKEQGAHDPEGTVQGAIDGSNQVFVVSFDFVTDSVNVYVNGRRKFQGFDDGFDVLPPRSVVTKEALRPGDTLEIEYKSDTKTGGGALGGCPEPMRASVIEPDAIVPREDLPELRTDEIEPSASTREDKPTVTASGMKPTLIRPADC